MAMVSVFYTTEIGQRYTSVFLFRFLAAQRCAGSLPGTSVTARALCRTVCVEAAVPDSGPT